MLNLNKIDHIIQKSIIETLNCINSFDLRVKYIINKKTSVKH
jgi:hypothetical protein